VSSEELIQAVKSLQFRLAAVEARLAPLDSRKRRTPCIRGCGRMSQRPDGICWQCSQGRKARS
jgi:hypothetical protein